MTAPVLRSELLKLRRTPSSWWLAAAAIGVVVLGIVLTLSLSDVSDRAGMRSLLSFSGTGGLVLLLLGVVVAAGEYRHHTIVPTVLGAPRRVPAFVGQLAAVGIFAIAVGVVTSTLATVIALPWLMARGVQIDLTIGDLATSWLGGTAYTALSAMIGVSVGALARNQVAAAITVFVYLSMIDPLLARVWSAYGRFGPTSIGIALSGGTAGAGGPSTRLLPIWGAGLLYLGAATLLGSLGAVAMVRRDLG